MPGLKRSRKDDVAESGGKAKKELHERKGDGSHKVKKARRASTDAASASASTSAAAPPKEVDFPRGGGSSLTPFEHHQVLREVKDESAKRREAKQQAAADDDLFSSDKKSKAGGKKALDRSKRQDGDRNKKGGKKSASNALKEGAKAELKTRVEALNYKRLLPGTRLLATILAVHPLALVVSLPNQLLGHVPITHISQPLTARLHQAADDSDDDDSESEQENEDEDEVMDGGEAKGSKGVPELRDLYQVGQWVSVSVVAVHSAEKVRGRERGREGGEYEQESRRVELSMDPRLVNEGVSPQDMSRGFVLPMAVRSKEDHGYLMDVGIEGFEGFLSFKDGASLHVGQVIEAAVLSVGDNKRTLSATTNAKELRKAELPSTSAPAISGLVPGNLVSALVMDSSNAGLHVKLWGMFDATIDSTHLPHTDREASGVPVGSKIKARILWDLGPAADTAASLEGDMASSSGSAHARKLALSAAPHVVELAEPASIVGQDIPSVGTDVEATVTSTLGDWGLTCKLEGTRLLGFAHISNVSDDHIERLPPTSGPFKIGTTHQARVVGHSLTDQVLQLSLKPSVLQRSFMRVSDVQIGQVVKATVKTVNSKAIILDLKGTVDGVVFPNHFSDVPLKKPEKKYKEGQAVKARILRVDPERNRIALTLKRTLVQSELPVVSSVIEGDVQAARVGVVTHAVVSKVLEGVAGPTAILVDMYGPVRAYVPISEATESPLTSSEAGSLRNAFFEGKVLKIRVTRIDKETGRVTASVRQATASYLAKLNLDAVDLGEKVHGKVVAVRRDIVVVNLEPSGVRALVGLHTVAQEKGCSVDDVKAMVSEGDELTNLTILDKSPEKGAVFCGGSNARAKVSATGATVEQGSVHTVKVMHKNETAAVVALPGGLRGKLHVTDCVDDFGAPRRDAASDLLPNEGDTIDVTVIQHLGKMADVSTRPSRRSTDAAKGKAPRDVLIDDAADVQEGQVVRGFVKSMAESAGLFVEVSRRLTGRVKIKDLFEERFVKDWMSEFEVGQLVEARVLKVVDKRRLDLTLKKVQGGQQQITPLPKLELKPGDKIKGFVKSVVEFGVFVQVEGANVSGLAHKSELSDNKSTSAQEALKAFNVGDRVMAKVLKVEAKADGSVKVSFGLKPSYFEPEDFDEDDEDDHSGSLEDGSDNDEDDEDEEGSDVEMDASQLLNGDSDDEEMLQLGEDSAEEDEEEEEAEESDDDEEQSMSEEDEDEEEEEATPPEAPASKSSGNVVAPALELAGGFSWSAQQDDDDERASDSASDSEQDSDGDDEEDEEARRKSDKKNKKKQKTVFEEDITADLATKKPESAMDFERLLLGSPDSSYLWIQFMSLQLQLSDVDRAREVGRKALKVINFREEQERFNVWVALLNLENSYGSDESFEATFKEACQTNESKKVHLRTAELLEVSGKIEKAHDVWKRTTKRFGHSSKVWVGFSRFLLRCQREDEARALIPRAMQSLERRKHVKTIVGFALAEFKLGDTERARTIFEGLVDSHPKKLDVWWQYIDQETRLNNVAQVR